MAKKNRRRPAAPPTPFEEARDELFQHIMQCGVIGAADEHQVEWFDDTMRYMAERYPELGEQKIADLRVLGERFAKPARRSPDVATDEPASTADDAVSEEAEEPAGSAA